MPTKAFAAVQYNSYMARLGVVDEQGKTIIVDGQSLFDYARHVNLDERMLQWEHEIVLPAISTLGIAHAINNPRAKHATFSKKGNAFSRIAHLVQTGYQYVFGGAVVPQHSGVVFRWTDKDLGKYCQKWMRHMARHMGGASAFDADFNIARELMLGSNEYLTSYYVFVDDGEIKSIGAAEAQKMRDMEESRQKALRAVNQGAEPGKRVFYL